MSRSYILTLPPDFVHIFFNLADQTFPERRLSSILMAVSLLLLCLDLQNIDIVQEIAFQDVVHNSSSGSDVLAAVPAFGVILSFWASMRV